MIASKAYIGNQEIVLSYLGDTQVTYFPKATQIVAVRNDPYSASLVLAMPLNKFPELGMASPYDDIHSLIKGTGQNYQIAVSGSIGTISTVADTPFTASGYVQSVATNAGKSLGTLNSTDFQLGSTWTIEGWVKQASLQYIMFFWKYVGGSPPNSEIYIDYNGNFNTVVDYNTNNEVQYSSGTITMPTYQWNHFAMQRDGTSNLYSLYLNGSRVYTALIQIPNTTTTPPQFLGRANENVYGYNQFQDYRIYKGVAKYSGATITPPQSIVYTINQ